jgi:hypothetical protein
MTLITHYVRGNIFSDGLWFSFEVSDEDGTCKICVKHPLNFVDNFKKDRSKCFSFHQEIDLPYSEFSSMQEGVLNQMVLKIKNRINKHDERL